MAEVPLAGGEVTSSRLFCFSWQLLLGFVRSFLAHRLFSCEKQRVLLDFIIFCFHWLLENKAVMNVTEKKKRVEPLNGDLWNSNGFHSYVCSPVMTAPSCCTDPKRGDVRKSSIVPLTQRWGEEKVTKYLLVHY